LDGWHRWTGRADKPFLAMIEQIHKQAALRPFRPFQIETSGGTLIRVSRPEWIYFPPETGHFVVFEGAVGSYISFRDVRSVLVEQPPVPVNGQQNGGE
jgi:hypothetical protein